MFRFRNRLFVGAVAAALTILPFSGCTKSQAEKNPDEIPPRPTGIETSEGRATTPPAPAPNSSQPTR